MSDAPPRLDPETVQSFVANAHGDLEVVSALLAEEPRSRERRLGLGRRATGRPASAPRRTWVAATSPSSCSSNGARLDIFAAAMLGDVEVVRAMLAAYPAKRDELGPHGIPLVAHARAGGADARAVLELLETDGGRRMSVVATDLDTAVSDAAAHLYVWALKDIPQDLRDALAEAAGRETSVTGQRVLQTILRNVTVAETEKNLVCQDTGIAVYYCKVGEHFPLHPARIYAALRDGTERATVEHPLRSNTVHTLTRENTGPNVGYRVPIVHWDFVPDWDGLDVKCVPKGSGSENMSFLKMCVPADGVTGIKKFVLESIVGAGGKPCPPGIVGVGIGGSADYAMHLAKEAIARPVGTHNPDPLVAQLEGELKDLLNETGVGPMGLGGDVTVLSVHVEHADTHMTLNPVAVNYQCWAARRASAHVAADGSVAYERDA